VDLVYGTVHEPLTRKFILRPQLSESNLASASYQRIAKHTIPPVDSGHVSVGVAHYRPPEPTTGTHFAILFHASASEEKISFGGEILSAKEPYLSFLDGLQGKP
jgi:hypothetical protein